MKFAKSHGSSYGRVAGLNRSLPFAWAKLAKLGGDSLQSVQLAKTFSF